MNREKEIEQQQNRFKQEMMNARALVVDKSIIDEENRTVRTVLATETPALVWDWERGIIREILLIENDSVNIPESRQVVLLESHNRYGTGSVRGSMQNLRIENNELVADTVFSSLAEDEFTKVREGHLTDVSVGYQTFADKSLVIASGETGIVNGRSFVNNYADKYPFVIRTNWTPKEGSLVAIGADEQAKFRSAFQNQNIDEIQNIKSQIESLTNSQREINANLTKISFKGEPKMSENTKTADEIRAEERKRVSEIEQYGKRFAGKFKNSDNSVSEFIQSGKSVDEFRNYVLDNLNNGAVAETPKSEIGMSNGETERFSITKTIMARASGNWNNASFEKTVIDTVEKNLGRSSEELGFFLPHEVQMRGARYLTTGTATAGGNLVGVDFRGNEYIEMLRSKTVLGAAGMTILTGLSADIAIPKVTGDATISMVAEGVAATATALTFGQETASPNTATANVPFSRKLLIQSNPTVDNLVLSSLQAQMNVKKDYMGLHGNGTAPNPLGIASATGIGSVSMATPSWKLIAQFAKEVAAADATFNKPAWIMDPTTKWILKSTLKASSTSVFLLENDLMDGAVTLDSTLVTAAHLFYGYWSQLVLCNFGNQQIIVDPYTLSTAGQIQTTIQDEFDYIIRNESSFALATDVPTT